MTGSSESKMAKYEDLKNLAAIIQSFLTVAAIIIGGIWFLYRGEAGTKANVSHVVSHVRISDDWTWVHIATRIENVGKTELDLDSGIIRIQQILPLHNKVSDKLIAGTSLVDEKWKIVLWPTVCPSYYFKGLEVNIAPGEDETIEHEFIIPSYIETAKIYSFIQTKGEEFGWDRTTIYHIPLERKVNKWHSK
jgi:hypothetical protein